MEKWDCSSSDGTMVSSGGPGGGNSMGSGTGDTGGGASSLSRKVEDQDDWTI